eukprot:COSAG04_NODE_21244_length_377_cov_1.003597_2_plen_54_part_01
MFSTLLVLNSVCVQQNTMYEAAARVPMILTGPGVTPNAVIPALASLYDVCTCNG